MKDFVCNHVYFFLFFANQVLLFRKLRLDDIGHLLEYIVYMGAMRGMQPLLIFMDEKLDERADDWAHFVS